MWEAAQHLWILPMLTALRQVSTKKIIGYDCDLANGATYTEFSLLDVGKCRNVSNQFQERRESWAQVIKRKEEGEIEVTHCQVRLSWAVANCGTGVYTRVWNQVDIVTGEMTKIEKERCLRAYDDKHLSLNNYRNNYGASTKTIEISLDDDRTARGWVYIQGSEHLSKNTCTYSSFAFRGTYYSTHILKMKYDIIIDKIKAKLNYKAKILKLSEKLGTKNIEKGSLFDSKAGLYVFDKLMAGEVANTLEYEEIIKGKATLFPPYNANKTQPIVMLQPQDCPLCSPRKTQTAMLLQSETKVCIGDIGCKMAFSTHIRGVYVIITERSWEEGPSFFKLKSLSATQEDKFIDLKATLGNYFLQTEIRLESSFNTVAQLLCEQSRQLIMANMERHALMTIGDSESTKGKDIMRRGSILYVMQCKKITVKLTANITSCHHDIPVTYKNLITNKTEKAFLNAVTHNLQPDSPITECSTIFPLKLAVQNIFEGTEYICFTPALLLDPFCAAPSFLEPLDVKKIFEPSTSNIDYGLYTVAQLEHINMLQYESLRQEVFNADLNAVSHGKDAGTRSINGISNFVENTIENSGDKIRRLILPSFLHGIIWCYDQAYTLIFLGLFASVILRVGYAIKRGIKELQTGQSCKLLTMDFIFRIVKAFLPSSNKCKCNCTDVNFVQEVHSQIIKREREQFLEELYR